MANPAGIFNGAVQDVARIVAEAALKDFPRVADVAGEPAHHRPQVVQVRMCPQALINVHPHLSGLARPVFLERRGVAAGTEHGIGIGNLLLGHPIRQECRDHRLSLELQRPALASQADRRLAKPRPDRGIELLRR